MAVAWSVQSSRLVRRRTAGVAVALERVETDALDAELRRDSVSVPFVATEGRRRDEVDADVLEVAKRLWQAREAAETAATGALDARGVETALNDWEVTRG